MIFQKNPAFFFPHKVIWNMSWFLHPVNGYLIHVLRRKIIFSEHYEANHLKHKAAVLSPCMDVCLGREITPGSCDFRTCCIFPPRSSSMRLKLRLLMGWTNQSSPPSPTLSAHCMGANSPAGGQLCRHHAVHHPLLKPLFVLEESVNCFSGPPCPMAGWHGWS